MKLFSSIIKDQKVIFRSWKSVIILVLGPLVVALLLAMSFSTSDRYDIKLGVYSENADISFLNSLFSRMEVVTFYNLDRCVSATMRQEVHGCLMVSQSDDEYQITFYIDHSRDQMSYLLLNFIEGSMREYLESIMSVEKLDEITSIKSGMLQSTSSFKEDLFEQGDSVRRMSYGVDSDVNEMKTEISYTKNDIYNYNTQVNQQIDERLTKLYKIDNTLYTMEYRISSVNFNVYSSAGVSITPLISMQNDMLSQIRGARSEVQYEINSLNNMKYQSNYNTQNFQNRLNNADNKLTNLQSKKGELLNLANTMEGGAGKVTELENSLNNMFSSSLLNFREYNLNVEELKFNLSEPESTSITLIRGLFPIILVMMLIFISVVFSNIISKNEMNSPAYIRWKLSPTPVWINTFGIMVSTVFLVLIQIGVLLMAGNTIFHIDYSYNLWGIVIILLVNIVFFSSIGIITSLLIKNDNASLLASIFIVISFYVVSGILIPLERTGSMINLFQYLPSSLTLAIFRKMILYGIDIFASMQQFTVLAIEAGVALIITMVIATFKK